MDPSTRALLRLNLDLGIFMSGIEEDEQRRMELELRHKHGF